MRQGSRDESEFNEDHLQGREFEIDRNRAAPQDKELLDLSEKISNIMNSLEQIQEESNKLETQLTEREEEINKKIKDLFQDELVKAIRSKAQSLNQSEVYIQHGEKPPTKSSHFQYNLQRIKLENADYLSDDSADEMLV